MQQIFNFVIRNKTFLCFLLLFGFAFLFTIQSHSYHKSRFINSANTISGGVYGTFANITGYFKLKRDNEVLLEENRRLRTQLFNIEKELDTIFVDTNYVDRNFKFIAADIYKNSYSGLDNYLLINKGSNDGVEQDFGVITSKGIVGIIDNTSKNYATALSILNRKSRINAQLKTSNHIGSLRWDGKSPEFAQLTDVSKFAPIKQGDTIVTGGQSSIFPQGIGIGTIATFKVDEGGDTYTINVKLFNDMTNIGHVYVVENLDADEIRQLENRNNE